MAVAALTTSSAAQAGALLGLFTWAVYWKRGEHHLWTAQYLQIAAGFPVAGAVAASIALQIGKIEAGSLCLAAEGAYIAAVWTCMLIYRAFFHRLHRFPGPFSWKLSKFVQSYHNRNFENYKIVDKLHKQYGEYVRTGPTELHVVDPDCAATILTSSARCGRGPWYEMGRPLKSMLETRDRKQHDSRRKVWDRGFGARALRDYEPRVDKYINILAERLESFKGEPLNVSKWLNYFSFDVMGELAFAHSFEMLETGKRHEVLDMLEKGQQPLGILGMLPWLFNFLTKVPGVSANYNRWLAYCENLIIERQKMKVDRPDIAHWLLDYQAAGHDSAGPEDDREWLRGDSRLVVVAGSDTTAAAGSFCFMRLCEDHKHVDRIREELALLDRTESNTFNALALQNNCAYLNAFIQEVLRLHPPVPGGFQRQTPPEGITITSNDDPGKSVFIPGEVNIWMPIWTLSRSEKCYTDPLKFAPERWLPEESPYTSDDSPKVLRKECFLPFSTGPMGCVGKALALQELRMVVAVLLDRFEPVFASGEDGEDLVVGSKDWFTLGLGKLEVCFRPVKK